MSAKILLMSLVLMSFTLPAAADVQAVDFFPTGAKFTFAVQPENDSGDFSLVIPGAFRSETVRVANPENVYGDISVSSHKRVKWIPSPLESLSRQTEIQLRNVNTISARKSALEQTLSLLKASVPESSKPQELFDYIVRAQELRKETEDELAELKILLKDEQDKYKLMSSELSEKSPRYADTFMTVKGRAKGTVLIEAFTSYASWKPRYILDLSSTESNVNVQMFITASQRTGLDYAGKITFHTKTPDESVSTPSLEPLRVGIKPKEETVVSTRMLRVSRTNKMYESARAASPMPEEEAFMASAPMMADEAEIPSPKVEETLADRTIEIFCKDDNVLTGDGTDRDFFVDRPIKLAGRIELILIPEQRNDAWIIASMDEGNEHLIPGTAELRVDNHPSGKTFIGEFGESHQKKVPFGYANQITVKKESLVEKTGVSWFSGVFTSGYKLEITNGTKDEQVVTVKDRLPIPTDEKIKLDVKRIEPKEKQRDKENRLTWEITVPAGATVPVIVDYTLSYPSGEELLYK